MIVRTYQRRSRTEARTSFPMSECEEELSSSQEYLGFSSQDSNSWHQQQQQEIFFQQEAKQKAPAGLSSLMEAQESGEMMAHVDEANFALDGLRPGQPLRIQRASLVSLLSICTSAQQRRLLRTQGMAKSVLDAIVALSTDDPPTALAAAALFYVLASDGQDEHLLDSAVCIQFLLKLLSPSLSDASEKKASLGSKLLGVTANSSLLKIPDSGTDRGGVAIKMKVQKLLSSMKEMQVGSGEQDEDTDCFPRQELNSRWLALLTLEKACLSTVALEDTSGSVRRVGGHFKERLRELGGLDAVCHVGANSFSFLKDVQANHILCNALKSTKITEMFESVRTLLKCMKVMENATFLSEQNQTHLLEMNLKLKSKGQELCFITLVISSIKTLSELLLKHKSQSSVKERWRKSCISQNNAHDGNSTKCCTKTVKESQISSTVTASDEDLKESKKIPPLTSASNGGRGRRKTGGLSGLQEKVDTSTVSENILSTSVSSTTFSVGGMDNNCTFASEALHNNGHNDAFLGASKKRVSASSTRNSKSTTAGKSSVGMKSFTGQEQQSAKSVEQKRNACSEDLVDPFMFTDEEPAPLKGKQMSRQKKLKGIQSSDNRMDTKLNGDDCPQCSNSSADLDGVKEQCDHEDQATEMQRAEECALLGDCLLAAVKVLMNLTNDNPRGCQQVASCGGLDTMASLIVDHYPLFQSRLFTSNKQKGKERDSESAENGLRRSDQNEEVLSDQDLDLLVVILGVLVNLVEKDTENRARLAASSVVLHRSTVGHTEMRGCRRGVIPLLCSIFLTKQGSGEAVEGGGRVVMESNDEAAVKQGQREAENMIVEAYAALLLGFLSKESENARHAIACCLPHHNLKVLVPVLERFVAFHLSLNMISSETHASVSEVIESCKQPL